MLYVHIFSFYVRASEKKMEYIIDDLITIDQSRYNDILLGKCLKNMGVKYRSQDFQNLEKIKRRCGNPMYKIGRVCTRIKNISNEEVQRILYNLGHNLPSIYIKEKDIDDLLNLMHDS